MLPVTHLGAEILFLVMGPWFLCLLSWMSMQSSQCWGMPHGLSQTSVEASHSLHSNRWLLLFISSEHLCLLYSANLDVIFVQQVRPALPALERLVHSNDEEVLTDACWALSYLSDGTNDKIQAVIEANVCPRLVLLLGWVLGSLIYGFLSLLILIANLCVSHPAILLHLFSFLPFARLGIL